MALAMGMLALLPQFQFWSERGVEWQRSNVSFDFDEVAYASYLNALISGRARLNDPYTGRDNSTESPQKESVFSIQLLPSYALALPARAFGLSAATTFIILRAVAAAAATLALFWLVAIVTGDSVFAAASALIVLCLGGLVGEPHSAWRILTMQTSIETLPFLRRYVPALPFPLFFVFAALSWQALISDETQSRILRALAAGLTLAVLIFSYFFLWTAALGWITILALLWITRKTEWRNALTVFAVIGAIALMALVPYAVLLTRRATTMDSTQLLTHSRAPVFSSPVVVGLVALFVLATTAWRKSIHWQKPAVLFAASFALLPLVVFNQQVITGLLLQPVHYSRYVANYASLVGIALAVMLTSRHNSSSRNSSLARVAVFLAVAVFTWSTFETVVRSRWLAQRNHERDEARRVALHFADLARRSNANGDTSLTAQVVLSLDPFLADLLPNDAPQPVLWAPHMFVFSGSSEKETRERLYQQLYYTGVDETAFAALASSDGYLPLILFGWERLNGKSYVAPITTADVQVEARRYGAYCAAFGAVQAALPRLGYVVVAATGGADLARVDLWYDRDAGERVGDFMIYRVRLK